MFSAECVVTEHCPGVSSQSYQKVPLMGMNHIFLLGSLFPWFSDEKAQLDNLPIIRLFKPVCDLHFSKWGASS